MYRGWSRGGGGGGGLHACQFSVIRTETSSFWRPKSLSLILKVTSRKKLSIFLILKCKQRFLVPFRQFVSPLVLRHNDVRETDLKRGP